MRSKLFVPGSRPELFAKAEASAADSLSFDLEEAVAEARGEVSRLADEQAALRRVATLVARGVAPPDVFAAVAHETGRLLESMRGTTGHIFNLGHGILPQAKIECVEALVQTVTNWQ